MEFLDILDARKTTNGFFKEEPVSLEHQHMLMKAASKAPSHMNSQPWRFILIDDKGTISNIADIAGSTMQRAMEGTFLTDNRQFFRFSKQECEQKGDGILISNLPDLLRPMAQTIFESDAIQSMIKHKVPKMLGDDNRELVAKSPLLMAVLLDPITYDDQQGKMDVYYSFANGVAVGMAMENIWLTCMELGMGIQFISTPNFFPEEWRKIKNMLEVPESLRLMAVMRLGYQPDGAKTASIHWKSSFRKSLDKYVSRNIYGNPEQEDN